MDSRAFKNKMYPILEAIMTNELHLASTTINNMIGKKKSLSKLSKRQITTLEMLKGLVLSKEAKFGEAQSYLTAYVEKNGEYDKSEDDDNKNSLLSLASILESHQELYSFVDKYVQKNGNDLEMGKYLLSIGISGWDLANVQKLLLKIFQSEKKTKYYLSSLYAQLLNFKIEAGEFLGPANPAKVKILKLFFPKIQASIDAESDVDEKKKLIKQFLEFKIQVLEALGEHSMIIDLLIEHSAEFDYTLHLDRFVSLLELNPEFLPKILEGFKKTLEEEFNESPIANYDRQFKLLQAIHRVQGKLFVNTLFSTEKKIVFDGYSGLLDKFENQEIDYATDFYSYFIYMNLKYLRRFGEEKNDKFRAKNYILLILDVIKLATDDGTLGAFAKFSKDLIRMYVDFYYKTNSILRELLHLFSASSELKDFIREELLSKLTSCKNDEIACLLDHHIIELSIQGKDLVDRTTSELLALILELSSKYNYYYSIIYPEGKPKMPEKGDRLPTDPYLFTIVEILRYMSESPMLVDQKTEIYFALYCIFEHTKITPYNFDLTLREAELNTKLCFYEENTELFNLKDLKGNQNDTLGYIFFKNEITFPLMSSFEKSSDYAYNFFSKAKRESVQIFRNAIKHSNPRVFEEFYLYDKMLSNSTYRLVIDNLSVDDILLKNLTKMRNESIENIEFILRRSIPFLKGEKKISFNYDLALMQFSPILTNKVCFRDFMGCFGYSKIQKLNLAVSLMIGFISQETLSKEQSLQLTELGDIISECRKEQNPTTSTLLEENNFHIFRRINNPFKDRFKDGTVVISADHLMEDYSTVIGLLELTIDIIGFLSSISGINCGAITKTYRPEDIELIRSRIEDTYKKIDEAEDRLLIGCKDVFNQSSFTTAMQSFHKLSLVSLLSVALKAKATKSIKALIKAGTVDESSRELFTYLREQKQVLVDRILRFESSIEKIANQERATPSVELLTKFFEENSWLNSYKEQMQASYSKRFKNCAMDIVAKLSSLAKQIK